MVSPQKKWGERFYSFGDLVALRLIQRLTQNRIPALRLRRAVKLLEQQFGAGQFPIQELRVLEHGRELVVIPPGSRSPFDPLKRQWVFHFDAAPAPAKMRSMIGLTPEQLFESALRMEATAESLPQAIETYRRVVSLSPDWIEAHINLGVAYYQIGQLGNARIAFQRAVELDPANGISRYNLGCVLEELGEIDEAIDQLQRAERAMPAHADVHFNLALAYEKRGERRIAREQWLLYLRYAPNGPWAEQARARLAQSPAPRKRKTPIPFRRRS